MPSSEERERLIISMDKKIDVLIAKFDAETKSNATHRTEIKDSMSSMQDRVRVIELWKSKMEVNQDDFKMVKHSIIRWVVGGMLTTLVAATAAIKLL